MHAISHSLFLFLILFFFSFFFPFFTLVLSPLFFSFLELPCVVLWWWWCCNSLLVVATIAMLILCTVRALYILSVVTGFTILPFNYFCLDLDVLLTTYWFVSCLATTTYLYWLCHCPLLDKENCFVCLFTVAFSLAIHHGRHLVVPAHPSLFWVACHPSRTFPPKEFKREPQNRLTLLPTARPYPFLPLTHDPPLLYWLGTGWWCLGLVRTPIPCMSKTCLLLMRLPWTEGSYMRFAAHSWLLMAWNVFWSSPLYGLLPPRVGPFLIMGFSPF